MQKLQLLHATATDITTNTTATTATLLIQLIQQLLLVVLPLLLLLPLLRLRDKDSGHTIRSAIAGNPMLHANLVAIRLIEPQL